MLVIDSNGSRWIERSHAERFVQGHVDLTVQEMHGVDHIEPMFTLASGGRSDAGIRAIGPGVVIAHDETNHAPGELR